MTSSHNGVPMISQYEKSVPCGRASPVQCWGDRLGSLYLLPLVQFETALEVGTGKPFSRGLIFMFMFVSNAAINQARELDMT